MMDDGWNFEKRKLHSLRRSALSSKKVLAEDGECTEFFLRICN